MAWLSGEFARLRDSVSGLAGGIDRPHAGNGSPRVLIVDDERGALAKLARELAELGFEISTTHSGERAVKICGRETFDIVLLDARMPGMDSLEALRQIRRERSSPRVILMSAYSVDELSQLAQKEGADACLRKPIDVPSLLRLLERPT